MIGGVCTGEVENSCLLECAAVSVVPDVSKQRDPCEIPGTTSPTTPTRIPGDLNRFSGLHIAL